jgi:hypothetical protein
MTANIMNTCDNSLLRAEAFLNSADKAAVRFHDSHISAQIEGTSAKLAWATEPDEVGGFVGDEEHILIHDINKAFAKETKAKLDADKTKETLAKSKEAASNARIEAGKKLIEARAKVPEGQWEKWCKAHITQRKKRDIINVMKLAGADDPQAALDAEREAARNRMKAGAETKKLLHLVERLTKLNLDQKREVISHLQKEVSDEESRVAEGSQAPAIGGGQE